MYSESALRNILKRLISKKVEDEVFEFKEAKKTFDSQRLGEYFSALSNEANLRKANEGWLIFGIADDGEIVGTKYREDTKRLNSLKKEIADKTNDRITFREIYAFTCKGKRVIMFEIPPALQGVPTTYNGFSYGREGESINPLSEEERETIFAEARIDDWSKKIVDDATLDDLDPKAILVARRNYIQKNPHLESEINSWDDAKFLDKAKITINGKITNTAIILLGKSESKHLVSPADPIIRWILKDKDNDVLDYYIGAGPFILEVEEIASRIRNLKYRYIPHGTLFPTEVDMYDAYTIREPLNNAIAHQNYQLGVRITVVERPDSLIFNNAGTFLPGSVEEVIARDSPSERYRNTFLVEAMHGLNMVDTIGSGIPRLFEKQRRKYFPMPDYVIENERVTVTIYGKVMNTDYARILAQNDDLAISEIMLLDKVQKKKVILKEEALLLQKKRLIEGRRPNYYLSRDVSAQMDLKAEYTINRGMDKQYYLDFIVQGISQHGEMTKAEIERMLMNKLPGSYNTIDKKRNKIKHLLTELRVKGIIYSVGKGYRSSWHLTNKKLDKEQKDNR